MADREINFSDFMNEMNNLKEFHFKKGMEKYDKDSYNSRLKDIDNDIKDIKNILKECDGKIVSNDITNFRDKNANRVFHDKVKQIEFKIQILSIPLNDKIETNILQRDTLLHYLEDILNLLFGIKNDYQSKIIKEMYINNNEILENIINKIQKLIDDTKNSINNWEKDKDSLQYKWKKIEYCSEDDKPINRLKTNFKDNIHAYVISTLSRLDDIKRNGGREKIVIKIDIAELEKMYPYLMGIQKSSTRSINNSQPVGNSNPFNSLYNLDFSGYDVEFVFKKNDSVDTPKDFCNKLLFENCIFANFTVKNEDFDFNVEKFIFKDCVILGELKFIGEKIGDEKDNLIIKQLRIDLCIIWGIFLENGEYENIEILKSVFINNNDLIYTLKKYLIIIEKKGIVVHGNIKNIAVNNCEIENIEIKRLGLYEGLEDKNFYLKLEAVKCKYVMLNVLEGEKILGSKEKDNNKNGYLIEVFGSEIDSFNVRGDANNKIDILEYKYKQDVKSNVNRITFENLIFKDKCKVDINSSNKDSTRMMKFMNCVFKSFFILDYDYGDMKMVNVKFDLDFLKNKELYEIGEFRRNLGYFCESLVDVMAKINHDNRKDLLLTNEIRANVFTIHEKRMELDKKINFDRERVVYYFNKWLAGYGANIWLPIAWMFGVNLSFVFLMWVVNSIDNKITLAIIGLSYVIFIYSLKYLFNNSVNKFIKKLFNSSMFELIKKIGKKIFDSKSYIVAFILAILILLSDAFDGNNNLFEVYYVNCIISINDLFKVDVFKIDVLKTYKDNYFLYYVKYFFSNFVPPLPDIIIGGHFDDGYTDMRKSWNPSMLWGFPKLVSSFMWYLIYKCVRFRNGG